MNISSPCRGLHVRGDLRSWKHTLTTSQGASQEASLQGKMEFSILSHTEGWEARLSFWGVRWCSAETASLPRIRPYLSPHREKTRKNGQNWFFAQGVFHIQKNLIPKIIFLKDEDVWLWKPFWKKSLLGSNDPKNSHFNCYPKPSLSPLPWLSASFCYKLSTFNLFFTMQSMWYPNIAPLSKLFLFSCQNYLVIATPQRESDPSVSENKNCGFVVPEVWQLTDS